MKAFTFTIFILVATAFAGCATNETTPTPATATPTPTPATPTPTPATPTIVPTVTPPTTVPVITPPVVIPEPVTNVTGNNTITSVYILSAPLVVNGTEASVCFRVGGQGHVRHVAVHYDSVSHPNATAFTDYKGGAAYADEPSKTLTGNLSIPAAWCVMVPVSGMTYLRAHAFTDAQSVMSEEKVIVDAIQPVDFTGTFPQISAHNTTIKLCWQATGPGTAVQTAVHFDFVSHPNATSFTQYSVGALYADEASKTLAANLTLPGSWCVNETLAAGDGATYYMRAHVAVRNESGNITHVLGPERSISVSPSVGVTNGLPVTAAAQSTVLVCWRAEGVGSIPHTAIHWDNVSHMGQTGVAFSSYKGGALYPANATAAASGGYTLPGPWCTNVEMPASGSIFFVTHALDQASGRNEISHEYRISVA